MEQCFSHLLSPIVIGSAVIRNRIIHPNASPHFLQGPETFPADPYIAHYASIARSGAGIIGIAEWDNIPPRRLGPAPMADLGHMQGFDLDDLSVENYISAMLEDIHFYGAKALICIQPLIDRRSFGVMPPKEGDPDDFGQFMPPPICDPAPGTPERERMEADAIRYWVDRLHRYNGMGYDGVTIRIDGYLSNGCYAREYGHPVDVETRTRFIRALLRQIRKEFSPDFIIEGMLHGEQPLGYRGGNLPGDGYETEDFCEFARLLEEEHLVDILQVREKDAAQGHPTSFNTKKGKQKVIEYCRMLKSRGCGLLLAPCGAFQDPWQAEALLAEGVCDMITMARGLIAEPAYVQKLTEGRPEDITPCILCNFCHGDLRPPFISRCSVNPMMGLMHKVDRMVKPAARKKRVAVIGGGPAGMKAAITAAERGHDVTLYERSGYLGGQLTHGEFFSFKWAIRDFRNWLAAQVEKSGVNVRMNTEALPEMIRAEEYDAVIAAVGVKPNLPSSILGLRDEKGNALYPTCYDIFGRESELGHRVVMVGGSETGIETAMYLAENGHDVTVLTRQRELAADTSHLHYITWDHLAVGEDGRARMACVWEKYPNIHGILEVTTQSVEGGTVTYIDRAGVEHTITGDSVVICGGVSPRAKEAAAYGTCAPEFYAVGDCNGGGRLADDIRDAWSKASQI